MAWNILGSAHQARGENEAARACYETAIKLVRTLPAAGSTYASALTNLGSLEINMGQFQAAENLLRKAKGISAKAADHVGMVAIETNLAVLAIDRNDIHAARGFLADAFREAEPANKLGDSDRAALYSIHGSLAAKGRDFATAVRDYQQSIDLWIRACGPKYYLIAVGYTLQADAYRELGEYDRASGDLSAALTLLDQTMGKETQLYAATELAQARLLRATGAKAKASQTEADAKSRLTAARRQQCDACSISAAVF
jgi:tetratricopeptide (TPR) repeat protein